jgi:hypothetical protein
MRGSTIGRVVWVLLVIVAAAGGYAVGSRRSHQTMIGTLQVEASGNLTQRIEVLSLLRMADVPAAIDRLESEADLLTQTIAGNTSADKRVLAYMKTYLSVAPPSPAREQALSAALSGVPVLEPGQCRTALKTLLLSVKGGKQP